MMFQWVHRLWLKMLRVGESVCMWGQAVYVDALYLPLSLAVNLKLL